MPRKTLKEMTALQVDKLKDSGYHRVGGVSGLCLQVRKTGSRSWVLRLTFGGKRRDLGLGSYPSVTLSMARERARQALDRAYAGYDPVEERKQQRRSLSNESTKPKMTFEDCMRAFSQDKVTHMKNAFRARQQFENSLTTYALPILGEIEVSEIASEHVLGVLRPIWTTKPDMASRVRGRIERVLNWASANGLREGENPARWRGHLDQILAAPNKVKARGHHPALPYKDMPGFMASLLNRKTSNSSLALRFLILTAARSGEVRGALWSEFDLESGIWTISAYRMKAGKLHRVPLSTQAKAILSATPRLAGTDLVWAGTGHRQMSDMTLSSITRKMHASELAAGGDGWKDAQTGRAITPHGFRSTFRDWAAEQTEWPREMAEIALAHSVGSEVERAYFRSDMLEKRRAMMQSWAQFATSCEQES